MTTIDIGGGKWVLSLVFLEDGRHIMSGGFDKFIRQWRIQDGGEVGGARIQATSEVRAISLSRDGRWIVSGENGVATVWDRNTRRMAQRVSVGGNTTVDTVDVSPDSTTFATGSRDKKVFIWNITTGVQVGGAFDHDGPLAGVKFSPDGRSIATATWGLPSLRIYDVLSGSVTRTIAVTSFSTTPISWSSDSQFVFAISHTSIRRIDATTAPPQWTDPSISSPIYSSIAHSSNDRFLAVFSDRSISLWDAATRAPIVPAVEHTARLWSIALSLDNNYLATGDENGIITLRDLRNVIQRSYLAGESVVQQLQGLLRARTPNGSYRIKSSTGNIYLAYQDGSTAVAVQQLDPSSAYQRWTISSTLDDGTYNITARPRNWLTAGNANELLCSRRRTSWTIEPRGNSHVIGNAANSMAIHLAQDNRRGMVLPRNVGVMFNFYHSASANIPWCMQNSLSQRWILEPIST